MQHYDSHTAVFMPVVHWAQDHGIPLASLLRDTGLEPERFFDDGSRMNTAQRFQMLQNLISLADQPALGMSTGSRARLEEIGALGLAMLVAPSVADAVRAGAQLSPSSGLVGHLEVHPHEGGLLLRLVLPALSPALEQYITEDFFATVASYLATLTAGFPAGETRPPPLAEARFRYPDPGSGDIYRAVLNTRKLRFGASHSELLLPARLLHIRPPLANEFTFQQMRSLCESFLREIRSDTSLLQECQALLARHLSHVRTAGQLAEALGMSTRSLQRALRRYGTTFSELRSDACNAVAMELLRNPALTIGDVALAVGYSDTPNFRRAFRQWQGVTPSEFRASLQALPHRKGLVSAKRGAK